MNTEEIVKMLQGDVMASRYPSKVLARDEFESLNEVEFPSFCVCNLDQSTEPGSHWVAVFLKALIIVNILILMAYYQFLRV